MAIHDEPELQAQHGDDPDYMDDDGDQDSNMTLLEDTDPNDLDCDPLDDPAMRCGYLSWKPNCLQCMNKPQMLLACVSWFTFVQGQLLLSRPRSLKRM